MSKRIVLFPGGTLQHTVDLDTYEFPGSLAVYALMVEQPGLRKALDNLDNLDKDIRALIECEKNGMPVPPFFDLPDLWHHRKSLPERDGKIMLKCCCIAVCIVKTIYEHMQPLSPQDGVNYVRHTRPRR